MTEYPIEAKRTIDALVAEVTRLRDQIGDCICNTGPDTDGPEEDCPKHGRSYKDWIERADYFQHKFAKAQNDLNRLRAGVERAEEKLRLVVYPDESMRTCAEVMRAAIELDGIAAGSTTDTHYQRREDF